MSPNPFSQKQLGVSNPQTVLTINVQKIKKTNVSNSFVSNTPVHNHFLNLADYLGLDKFNNTRTIIESFWSTFKQSNLHYPFYKSVKA
jgi:hypothetical protein